MADPQTQTEPLIPSQQTAIHVGTPAGGGSSSRAYKVAGFTLLACLLIAGQALTAYFVLSQKDDIKSLQEQNDNLKEDLSAGRAAAVPVRIHAPMNVMPKLMDDFTEETSAQVPKEGLEFATQCQLEAAGLKATGLRTVAQPVFRPRCDDQGNYLSQQCWQGKQCWCVDSAGKVIPGTTAMGPADCSGVSAPGVAFGGLNRFASPDVLQEPKDEEPEPNLKVPA